MARTSLNCVICGTLYPVNNSSAKGLTCSDACYEEFKRIIVKGHGDFTKVVSRAGIAYKVPTLYIVEHSLKEEELPKFPFWTDVPKGSGP